MTTLRQFIDGVEDMIRRDASVADLPVVCQSALGGFHPVGEVRADLMFNTGDESFSERVVFVFPAD